ncbi:restriction endonuclease subunit M [Flavobacterium sp. TBRC 19031]|uniref:restriction endonuclease subunit M n=1 Tax=Flavobacterium mekongense TaxID=3379707 RepID=UPI0039997BD4
MSLIQQGIDKGLITISDDNKTVKYLYQNKSRNFSNPEEKVQVEAFLRLILEYGYPVEHIEQFVTVTMGADKREADIIVYEDAKQSKPKIIVECKKQEVTQQEFNQAINQAFSYANALSGTVKYVWVYSEVLSSIFRFDKEKDLREGLSDLPHYGTDSVAPYNFVKGGGSHQYIDSKGNKQTQIFKDIKTVSEEELTRRFKQAHDALWAGGQLNPSEAFDELDKLIFCKIWDEKYNIVEGKLKPRKKGEIYDFQVIKEATEAKTNDALAKRVKAIYAAGKSFDKEVFKDDIRLSNERIRTIVNYLQEINLSATDLDSKGRAFETFMGSFFRGEFGQYFTPRVIVQFIVEALPIDNSSLVLDTSCGSGGFLLHALDKVRRQADKEYPDYKTDIEDHKAWYDYWHSFAENNLYGIEINEQIARTAKMNMIIHDDGHTNVISVDGLLNDKEMALTTGNNGFQYNRFDFIITNPPFGSSVKDNEKHYLRRYFLGTKQVDWLDYKNSKETYRNNQSTEVLFIEQCYNYLREGGYLAVVIPDGILTNSSLQYVRDVIEDWFRLVAVISMPQTAFSATGAGVKSSVLFVKKHPKTHTEYLQTLKVIIQNDIKREFDYLNTIAQLEKEKKIKLDKMDGFTHPAGLTSVKEIKASDEYKEWKTVVNQFYSDKISELQEEMTVRYQEERAKQLPDYPIFMAIAENIGYDAVGKTSAKLLSKNEIIEGNYKLVTEELSHDLYDEKITKKYDLHDDKEELSTKKEIVDAGILKELRNFITAVENGRI